MYETHLDTLLLPEHGSFPSRLVAQTNPRIEHISIFQGIRDIKLCNRFHHETTMNGLTGSKVSFQQELEN
jgi:hypothetical protein